jgi:hypothetical protein
MKIIRLILLCSLLVIVPVVHIFTEDMELSIVERKELQMFPELNWKEIKSGKWTSELSDYLSEQFPYRNELRSIKTTLDELIGKTYNNSHYFDGLHVFELGIEINELILKDYYKKYETYQTYFDGDSNFLVIPDKSFYKGYLDYELEGNVIDLRDILSLNDFYQFDHHWNISGINKVLSFLSIENENNEYILSNDFNGSYYGQYGNLFLNKESIYTIDQDSQICLYDTLVDYSCFESLYFMDELESIDQYSVFLGGNRGLITIEGNVNANKELVIFRDSYASSLVPGLINSYSKIVLIDERYLNFYQAKDLLFENGIISSKSDMMFLYQIKSIS